MKWHPQSAPRRVLRWTRRLVLALLLPFLLLAGFGQWWLLPRLNDYRDDLARALEDYLRVPVRIAAVSATRDGWRLGLRLRGVSLSDPDGDATLASFTQAVITLNLWRSLREWRPALGRIRLEGAKLTLEQGPDGTPRLLGDAADADVASSLPEFVRWLFSLPRLEIVGERLVVRRPDGVTLRFPHPYLQLKETAHGQRLAFTAELPDGFGGRLQLIVERRHEGLADPERGQGRFELRADRLNPAAWPLLPTAAGQAGLELRGDWRDWRPVRLEGQLRLARAARGGEGHPVPPESRQARLPEGELRFDGRRLATGWQLQGNARFGDGKGQVAAQPTFELNQTGGQWQGSVRELRAQDLLAWVTPWLDEAARRWLVPLDLHGELPEIAFQAGPNLADYSATVQLRGVACRPVRGLPGFDNVTGTLEFGSDRGRIELDSRKIRVNTDGLLRAPITLDALRGTVNWRRSTDGLSLESTGLTLANADLDARFWGSVTVPDAGEPSLDIQGQYRDVRGEQARRYLPVAVIPAEAVAWLDRALVGGRVVAGEVVFRGPPARFPFDGGEGLFETRFRVENAVVDYRPGWPRLEQGRATVTFRNRGLRVEVEAGRLLDGQVENASAWIDDLANVVVQARGRVKGAGASMWHALEDSPAGRALGENLPALRIDGVATLDLELAIPLDPRPNRVWGRVGLAGNGVSLPTWNIELDRLRGDVRFTESDLEANNVQAALRGEPVRLDLDLAGREGRRELRVQLQGRLSLPALLGEPAVALEPYLAGRSAWEAVLTVPTHRREQRNAPAFTLDLDSDLRGAAVRLPAPLGKATGEARPLRISLYPSGRETGLSLALEYGPAVRAALELEDFPRQPRLARGELRIDAGPAKLPDAPGLVVFANLPRWSPHIPVGPSDTNDSVAGSARRRAAAAAGAEPKTAEFWRVLRGVEARIGELVIGGRSFSGVTLRAVREQDGMRVELDGEALAGRVTVPDEPTPRRPVNAALQRLHVGRTVAEASGRAPFAEIDPRRLPPLVLTAAELRVNEATLGRLRLIAMPRPDGIRLTELDLNSERQRIDASGEWWWTGGGQASRLQATLRSQALGETLAAFGYPGSGVDRGETQAELAVEWAAPLPDFALERLEGNLKFEVGSGQLRDINPGLGRMIGMFGVQNLTRRLSFDFSDLFQPGMGFDRIAGEFTFKRGQAYTDDLLIEAPAARIEIQGRVGLQARDYDQTITVVPHYGGALPVAGAIAGGPAVGAAVFVAERLLQKGIEHATRYRYHLTGSWDNPLLKSLQESPAAEVKGFASDK